MPRTKWVIVILCIFLSVSLSVQTRRALVIGLGEQQDISPLVILWSSFGVPLIYRRCNVDVT